MTLLHSAPLCCATFARAKIGTLSEKPLIAELKLTLTDSHFPPLARVRGKFVGGGARQRLPPVAALAHPPPAHRQKCTGLG